MALYSGGDASKQVQDSQPVEVVGANPDKGSTAMLDGGVSGLWTLQDDET